MPSLLALLLFCDFLENRLHTSNLALLRRMFSDFFAGNEHTLQDFIRLGASVVTVMPMERKNQLYRQEAERLLSQQQHMMEDSKQQTQLCVFSYLSARVATKNIFLLRDMFQEFSDGGETLICEFVGRGNEVISLIPVDIQALQVQPQPIGLEIPVERKVEQKQQQEGDSESEEEDDEVDTEDDDEIATLAELASVASMPPTRKELRTCIMEVLDRIEEQEPWSQVFNPDTLPMPFKRHKLVDALKTFWTENSRAVWERRFWGPLMKLPDQRRYGARKSRQSKARAAFQRLMTVVYEELGANFFVQMDQRTKPHQGWWYSEPVQNLSSLAQRLGLAECLDYIDSQTLERFPAIPSGNSVAKAKKSKIKSMWATTSTMAPILREICALKDATKCAENKKK